MSSRTLFAMVVALAVLFVPSTALAFDQAMAMPNHHMQMMEAGHCQMPPGGSTDQSKGGNGCCIAMCIAVAVAPSAPEAVELAELESPVFPVSVFRLSFLGEIATPPPRHA